MTVHHLNCGSMRPRGTFFGRLAPQRVVCHVLLVERNDGLLLVDSGYGTGDLADPGRLGRPFRLAMHPLLDQAEAAVAHVRRLGHDPSDVRDIVLTHLDLDHAGGLGDFPQARVHVAEVELGAAQNPGPLLERRRYVTAQWAHGPDWVTHPDQGDDWRGLTAVRALGDDVVLVPLHGHTHGHCGVAVKDGDRWLLHAGDTYFYAGEVETPPRYMPGLVAFQRLMAVDERARRNNQARLRALRRGHSDVTVFSAHDATELDALAG